MPCFRPKLRTAILLATAAAGLVPVGSKAQTPIGPDTVGRTVETTHPPRWPSETQAPRGAPNVIVILTDDVGFGVTSTFGGPVPTPNFDALARNGLRYNRFNTTALCSPTRAALLTGHIPQNVNMGNVTNLPTGYDGYTTVIPKNTATIARVLRDAGYNTAMFGKGHITPEWEMSPAGPFDRWPTGLGFDYFYGFLSADTSQWNPSLVENTTPVEPPHGDRAYIFENDIADHAIGWVRAHEAADPSKPFFIYYAPGASHTPHHAPKEWIEKFRGRFDMGWDKLREETFERQKREGIIPADAGLSPRPASLPAWDSLTPEQKRVFARLAECYAAETAYSDAQTGRLLDALRADGLLDNTLIIYIEGDNGASAEGGLQGLSFEQSEITGQKESFAQLAANFDKFGGPEMYNHMPAAWAWAFDTPFPWWKQIASQAGGVRNGMVISWPGHIKDPGALRSQYGYVADIMPTVLEAAGVPMPESVDGITQKPIDGISLAYTFAHPSAPSARREQIYEMMENFGIYKDGWMAGTLPKRMAWEVGVGEDHKLGISSNDRQWTLFDLESDFTTANDLSAKDPAKLKAMQDLFWQEAAKNNILPIHDWSQGTAGRPSLGAGRRDFVYHDGLTRLNEDAAPHTIGHSFRITADVTLNSEHDHGVMITQGGRFGGYAFYLLDGRPVFHYNAVGPDQFRIAAPDRIGPGEHRLTADFTIDRPAPGSPGTLTIAVDGKQVAQGRIERTVAGWMSHTEGLDVGHDTITPENDDYTIPTSRFSGMLGEIHFEIR
jgi:arylsulfatase